MIFDQKYSLRSNNNGFNFVHLAVIVFPASLNTVKACYSEPLGSQDFVHCNECSL